MADARASSSRLRFLSAGFGDVFSSMETSGGVRVPFAEAMSSALRLPNSFFRAQNATLRARWLLGKVPRQAHEKGRHGWGKPGQTTARAFEESAGQKTERQRRGKIGRRRREERDGVRGQLHSLPSIASSQSTVNRPRPKVLATTTFVITTEYIH